MQIWKPKLQNVTLATIKTVDEAIESPQLSELKLNNEGQAIVIISKILVQMYKQEQDDVANDKEFIIGMSEAILSNFWNYRIGDIILAINNGLNGLYGKTYGKIKRSTISEWLLEYNSQKLNALEAKNRNNTASVLMIENKSGISLSEYLKSKDNEAPLKKLLVAETSEQRLERLNKMRLDDAKDRQKAMKSDAKLVKLNKMSEQEFKHKWG